MTMPAAPIALNPLTLPLTGLQVIEASAGTGKTWTLAALYVRLVLGHAPGQPSQASGNAILGHGLYPPQILVMTFTEAATAELRNRIRERLSQAAHYFAQGETPDQQADAFLRNLRAQIPQDQWATCAYRLDMAAQWMDDAAIFTIHGWSSRMLKTHAFDSGSLFQQSRVDDSDRLKLTAVQDYWRTWFYPLTAAQLAAIKPLGPTPHDLLQLLADRWALQDKAPQIHTAPPQAPHAVIGAWEHWQQLRAALEPLARRAWTADIIALITDAVARKAIKGVQARWLPGWLEQMAQWQGGGNIKLDTLGRFSAGPLLEKGWLAAGEHMVFAHIEALHDHLGTEPPVGEQLLAHATHAVGEAYCHAKETLAQFDFSDLLQHLYHALQPRDGQPAPLAAAIRQQFPVALVDEFQDTDPWQYGALSAIYGEPAAPPSSLHATATATATALIMIGDPKQAIYSFRGADLNTYLAARRDAQAIHTLSGNFRSTAGVVAAVNHVFSRAIQPFGDVPFEPVVACNEKEHPLQVNGQVHAAMTVWHLPTAKPQRKAVWMRHMAALFATQMVALLNQGATRPGDMAVLVRGWSEARAIRSALSERGVRSVYLSERDSVFATPQATDLWRILRAVAHPQATALVRAALATPLWGLAWPELEALLHNEPAWDALTERFHRWQATWQRRGFLPMLHQLLHDQSIPARLLHPDGGALHSRNDGERQLTNVLHLGDLLQTASLALQGEGALIRYLEDQMRSPKASGDTAQLRLESDAHLVQVITLHKAKGLQYPLVFLPFASHYRAETAASGKDETLRLAEDVRLLYVGLTRAKQALWLGVTPIKGDVDGDRPKVKSALSLLLGRSEATDMAQCLAGWAASEHIAVRNAPEPTQAVYTPAASDNERKPALQPQRMLASRWWTASFSSLARGAALHAAPSLVPESDHDERMGDAHIDNATPLLADPDPAINLASDALQPAHPPLPFNAFKAGSTYGTLLHDLLEWQAHNDWPAAQANPSPSATAQWQGMLTHKARRLALDQEQHALLADWIPHIVRTPLPVHTLLATASNAIVLGAMNAQDTWAEMGFSLQVQSLSSSQLDGLIQQHTLVGHARQALHPRQLEGMLTGFMDLVLQFEGRYYVLDYKSNKLPAYTPAHLQHALLAHRYDVQYALYLLALHRLLKARLPGYNYDQHMGGALYVFLRGIDQPGAGLYADCPPEALIDALDAAFSATPHDHEATP